jgi:hypothetical protein
MSIADDPFEAHAIGGAQERRAIREALAEAKPTDMRARNDRLEHALALDERLLAQIVIVDVQEIRTPTRTAVRRLRRGSGAHENQVGETTLGWSVSHIHD